MTTKLERASSALYALANDMEGRKDVEVEGLAFVLPQYVTNHNDKGAYAHIDKQVNALARAYDHMIKLLRKTAEQAEVIEKSVDSFYGD